jgi:glycerol-3-phosphate acyltransferase PlsY
MIVPLVVALVIGYLLGSIPSAYIAARLKKGTDIREMGGGNVGALNTFREVGAVAGIIVLLADVSKGVAAVLIAGALIPPHLVPLCGLAAVVGHNWPLWLRFKGGKGAATTIGVFASLVPIWQVILIFAGLMVVPLLITRNPVLSMTVGFVFWPFIAWGFGVPGQFILFALPLPLVVAWCHLPAFRRDLAKAENMRAFIFDRWQRGRD